MFDGRIGIWAFIEEAEAKRNRKNRKKVVLETKPITSITSDVYRHYMITYVLPAIKEKWPVGWSGQIKIQ